MQEDFEERSVLGYFPSSENAGKAAEDLRELGYQTVQVERISHYGDGGGGEAGIPYAGGGEITGMTLFSYPGSSLYGGNMPENRAGDNSFLVTVVANEGNSRQVRSILEKYGGRV
ncbi:MAG: hypothetical protein ACOY46_00315 [Bacillota bacterium]